MRNTVVIVISSLLLFACQSKIKGKDELATAFGNKLYEADVQNALKTAANGIDSIQLINKYVDNWLMSEILYNEAKKEIGTTKSIEKLVDDYKKSLYIHELEKKKLNELDTAELASQLDASIKAPESASLLVEPCLRFLFVRVKDEVYNDTLKSIWKTEDLPALDIYIRQRGGLALLEVDKWYYSSEFNSLTPSELRNKINYSKTESYSLNQEGEQLLLKILEYRKADSPEPEELTIPRLRQRILHDKSILFIKEYKKELYQNNIKSKNIHINKN